MRIFHASFTLANLKKLSAGTMIEHLAIEFTEIGDDYVSARMPVDHRTHQPYGLLHGGASLALAETLGSVASAYAVDMTKYISVGLDINANHVRGIRSGTVTGTARPVHLGKSTHVWEIRIVNEEEKLVCIARITTAILEKKQ